MVIFTSKTDYAMILLTELAKKSGYVSLGKLAKEKNLPYRYISRIAGTLKQAGIIESKEGVTGGYTLGMKPEQISIVAILKLFEDSVGTTRCTVHGNACPRDGKCDLQPKWMQIQKEITEQLQKYTLADFI